MEQTFNDLYNERKRKTEQGLFGFVLWVFIETSIGIIKEHTLRIMRGDSMKNIFIHFRSTGAHQLSRRGSVHDPRIGNQANFQ
jgi:hypothetical protein